MADQQHVGPADVLLIVDDGMPFELVVRAARAGCLGPCDARRPCFFWLRALSTPAPGASANGAPDCGLDARGPSRAMLVLDLARPTSGPGMRACARLLAAAAASALELSVARVDGGARDADAAGVEDAGFLCADVLSELRSWLRALADAGTPRGPSRDERVEMAVEYVCEWLARVGGATLAGSYWPDLPLCAALAQLLIACGAPRAAHALVDATLCCCEGLLHRARLDIAPELAQLRAELVNAWPDSHSRPDECAVAARSSRTYARQLAEPTAAMARLLARSGDACGDARAASAACAREVAVCCLALGERHELTLRAQLGLAAALVAAGDARLAEAVARQVCAATRIARGGAEGALDARRHSEAPTRHASVHSSRVSLGVHAAAPEQPMAAADSRQRVAGAASDAHVDFELADASKPAAPVRAALALQARSALVCALAAQGRATDIV